MRTVHPVRETIVFVKAEAVAGTVEFPAAADRLRVLGMPTLTQDPTYTESEELADTLDVLDLARDQVGQGNFSLGTYLRPSGVAGTAPLEDALLAALLPAKTVTPGVKVEYKPALLKPTVSIWWRLGDTIRFAEGAVVSRLGLSSNAKGFTRAQWEGVFKRLGWAAPTAVNGVHEIDDTTIVVDDTDKLSVGARVKIGADVTVYTVTALDKATETMTISPGLVAQSPDDAAVTPYLPDPAAVADKALEARKATVTIDGVTGKFNDLSLDIAGDDQYLSEEVSASEYPEEYVEGKRTVGGSLSAVFRSENTTEWAKGMRNADRTMLFKLDDGAGRIVEASLARARIQVPETNEAGPAVGFTRKFTGLGTAGEDSVSITYK